MGMAAQRYGISDDNWQQQLEAAITAMKRVAARGGMTAYKDLNQEISETTGLDPFDFTHPEGRNAMSELLGEAVELTVDELDGMLSAVVVYSGGDGPGPGFFNLAVALGLLPADASEGDKEKFWWKQTEAVQAACKPKRRR